MGSLLDDLAAIEWSSKTCWKELASIKERIRTGETTDDLLFDFLILYHNGIRDDAPYRKVIAALEEKVGAEILVVREQLSMTWIRGIYPQVETPPHQITRLIRTEYGVITGPLDINLKEGTFILPVQQHWCSLDNADWYKLAGPLLIDSFDIPFLDHVLGDRRDGIEPRSFTLKVGEELLPYFHAIKQYRAYQHLQELLRGDQTTKEE